MACPLLKLKTKRSALLSHHHRQRILMVGCNKFTCLFQQAHNVFVVHRQNNGGVSKERESLFLSCCSSEETPSCAVRNPGRERSGVPSIPRISFVSASRKRSAGQEGGEHFQRIFQGIFYKRQRSTSGQLCKTLIRQDCCRHADSPFRTIPV